MKPHVAPTLDLRNAERVFDELRTRLPAYVPEWRAAEGHPGWALLQICSRYMQVLIDRLNQAPDKNLLAFLDMLGISLISAQAARAPVVFQPLPNATDGQIAARTRLGAQVSGRAEPLLFETESAIALAAAQLVEVKTLWPASDEYADHTAAVAGGRPFTLFAPRSAVPHEMYLAHNTLLSFAGETTVELMFELATPGSQSLKIAWEYWNGEGWRPFAPFDHTDKTASRDGTNGLTRSGVVTLRAACGQAVKTRANGIEAYWVRGRLDQPLPPNPARVLPLIDRIGLRSVIKREGQSIASAQVGSSTSVTPGLLPDRAFANGTELDLTKEFYPFGRAPNRDTAFHFSSQEVFSKPGADVTVRFRRAITPEDEADMEDERLERDVNHVRAVLIAALTEAAQGVHDAAVQVLLIVPPTPPSQPASPYQILTKAIEALNQAITHFPHQGEYRFLGTFPDKVRYLTGKVDEVVNAIGIMVSPAVSHLRTPPGTSVPPTDVEITNLTNFGRTHIRRCYDTAKDAAAHMKAILESLRSLGPFPTALATGTEEPQITPARLVWEYWDGGRWQIVVPASDVPGKNFRLAQPAELAEISISFPVPKDMAETKVSGVDARWIRVRIERGSYNKLQLVSWYDPEAAKINFFPLLEPRPPALDTFSLSYVYRSSSALSLSGGSSSASTASSLSTPPEHCLTYNDFQFELHSDEVRWPGRFFPPFRPGADTTPVLYLGFDRPLPNDLVSLYLDVQESATSTPPLVWEGWDGMDWRELSISDETADLRRPGMVSFIAPSIAPRPQATVRRAKDMQITVSSAMEAAVFLPGHQVVIRHEKTREMARVQQIQDNVLLLETPLANIYTNGTVSLAALPRFGTPCDWVRARLKVDGAPAKLLANSIYLNAAWATQVQTIDNEVLGSSTGQPNQVFFLSQIPVLPGEQIEVCELKGGRAAVEEPILRQELRTRGLGEDEIRTVTEPRSGRITEVWVRWQPRPLFAFSGPEDRHYVVERARGRLLFGDGQHGRIPPVGVNNIRVRSYRAGGGLVGNVPAGKITQLLSAASFAQAVTNPRAAEGGADGEAPEAVRTRGPQTLRHRGRSSAARDYEALAREASPGVAVARALPATAPNGRPAPGWVTVIIVPHSREPQPQPSFELRRQVQAYLAVRAPATVLAEHITVTGPTYLPIGVAAVVAPRTTSEAGLVKRRVEAALESFLHPLSGGPEGRGWPFGRDVYLSDMAAIVEAVNGVDYAERLDLLLRDVPQGEWIDVPPERMVVAGTLHLEMKAPER